MPQLSINVPTLKKVSQRSCSFLKHPQFSICLLWICPNYPKCPAPLKYGNFQTCPNLAYFSKTLTFTKIGVQNMSIRTHMHAHTHAHTLSHLWPFQAKLLYNNLDDIRTTSTLTLPHFCWHRHTHTDTWHVWTC